MAYGTASTFHRQTAKRKARVLAALSASLMLSACAMMGEESRSSFADNRLAPGATPSVPKTELEQATAYWAEEFSKKPRDLDAALNYAANLKASGQKSQAMMVLKQASIFHNSDRRLASEYGRLALEMDQINVASQLLAAADDPANPDWRVISGRGTVLAKQGKYKEAIPFFERASVLAPNQASVMNNLALAYTMNGEAEKAEGLLRQASLAQGASPKVQQNLALVLGLQGKYDEAKSVASTAVPANTAAENTELIRRMVKLPAKSIPAAEPAVATAQPAAAPVVQAAQAAPALKPAAVDVAKPTAPDTTAWATEFDGTPAAPVLKPSTR